MTEASGTGLAIAVNASLRGDEFCVGGNDPSMLALNPRFGTLSDEAGPQPAIPGRSIRLRKIVRYDRDGDISSDLFGVEWSV